MCPVVQWVTAVRHEGEIVDEGSEFTETRHLSLEDRFGAEAVDHVHDRLDAAPLISKRVARSTSRLEVDHEVGGVLTLAGPRGNVEGKPRLIVDDEVCLDS